MPDQVKVLLYSVKTYSIEVTQCLTPSSIEQKEVEEYRKIDPITKLKKLFYQRNMVKSDIEKIDKKVKNIISKCEEFSESSPFPEKSVMYDVVYEQKDYPFIEHKID